MINDLKAWLPKVKTGGIIAGHDYHDGGPGVIKAVNETFGKNKLRFADGSVWYYKV